MSSGHDASRGFHIGVIGPGDDATEAHVQAARQVGRLLASDGHMIVTGGLGGVMEAACQGAREAGGVTVGLLPGLRRQDGNEHLTVAIPTGLGELRNGLVVRASDAVIAVGGSWGTLSEIALAVRTGVPVISLLGWDLPADGCVPVESASDAVSEAVRLAQVSVEGS